MYSFRQRQDTRVVDEPLYGHYLRVSGVAHPGRNDVLNAMDQEGERVVREIILGPCDRPVLFLKNMAHHLRDLELDFLDRVQIILLTRDPVYMLPSLAKHYPNPTLADTGFTQQIELLEHELYKGKTPLVLDAREVLVNPRIVLAKACHRLGLTFAEAMLSWPVGPKPEDGVWARYWYDEVHRSTGFTSYRQQNRRFPENLLPLLSQAKPLYNRLAGYAIRAC